MSTARIPTDPQEEPLVSLQDVIATDAFSARPARSPDLKKENDSQII